MKKITIFVAIILEFSTVKALPALDAVDVSLMDVQNQQESERQIGKALFLNGGIKNLAMKRDSATNEVILSFDYPEQRWTFSGQSLNPNPTQILIQLYTKDGISLGGSLSKRLVAESAVKELNLNVVGGSRTEKINGITLSSYSPPIQPIKKQSNEIRIALLKRVPVSAVAKAEISFNEPNRIVKSAVYFETDENLPADSCLFFGKPVKFVPGKRIIKIKNNCHYPNGEFFLKKGMASLLP